MSESQIYFSGLSLKELVQVVSELNGTNVVSTRKKVVTDNTQKTCRTKLEEIICSMHLSNKWEVNSQFQNLYEEIVTAYNMAQSFEEQAVLIKFRILAVYCIQITSIQASQETQEYNIKCQVKDVFNLLLYLDEVQQTIATETQSIFRSLFRDRKAQLQRKSVIFAALSSARRLAYSITGVLLPVHNSRNEPIKLVTQYVPNVFVKSDELTFLFYPNKGLIADKLYSLELKGAVPLHTEHHVVTVYNLESKLPINTIVCSGRVGGMLVTRHHILINTTENTVCVHDINSLELLRTLYTNDSGNVVAMLRLEGNEHNEDNTAGNRLVCTTSSVVIVFDVDSGDELALIKTPLRTIRCMAVFGDKLYLSCSDVPEAGDIGIISLSTHTYCTTLKSNNPNKAAVGGWLAADNRLFSYAGDSIRVWDTATDKVVHTISRCSKQRGDWRGDSVVALVIFEGVLCGLVMNALILWDAQTFKEIHRIDSPNGDILYISVCVVNRQLFVGTLDSKIVVFDAAMVAEMTRR